MDSILQPIVSFMALGVAVYVVRIARRNRVSAYGMFAVAGVLAFSSLRYIGGAPIETIQTTLFVARVVLLVFLVTVAFRYRHHPEAA